MVSKELAFDTSSINLSTVMASMDGLQLHVHLTRFLATVGVSRPLINKRRNLCSNITRPQMVISLYSSQFNIFSSLFSSVK